MTGAARDRRRDAAAAHQARWLADAAEVGWLTSLPPVDAGQRSAGRSSVGSAVELTVDDDGAALFAVPLDSPHRAALATGGDAVLLITEPAMGGLEPRDAARLTLLGRPVAGADRSSAGVSSAGLLGRGARPGRCSGEQLVRLDVTSARYKPRVGSWLREITIGAEAWRATRAGGLPAELATLVDHLNAEHEQLLADLFTTASAPVDTESVVIAGVRPDRLELSALGRDGVTVARLAFRRPVATAADLAAELLRRLGRMGWGHCTRTRYSCSP